MKPIIQKNNRMRQRNNDLCDSSEILSLSHIKLYLHFHIFYVASPVGIGFSDIFMKKYTNCLL